MQRIYLDHNATTCLDQRVLQAVTKELEEGLGNPSSVHFHGRQSRHRLEHSRQIIAKFLNVKNQEIIFTSGGTEGAHLLLHGALQGNYTGHIITSDVEHSCVYETAKDLKKRGCEVSFLPAGLHGAIRPEAVKEAIQGSTRLICLMAVNNETGVKTDIEAIGAIAQEANIPFIVDGVALLGKERLAIHPGVSAQFFSGHKLHAPKGVGFIFSRQPFKWTPILMGGGQEFNRRPGTENLPGIVGLATAIEILTQEQEVASLHMRNMRDRLEKGLRDSLQDILINGQGNRVVNTSNISFLGVDGESLLISLDREGISVSHGSACSSGTSVNSRILSNMGLTLPQCHSAIRFSTSRFTTEREIDRSIEVVISLVKLLRAKSARKSDTHHSFEK